MEKNVRLELESDGTGILVAEGDLNIYGAGALKAALSEAIESSERVALDFQAVVSVDLPCLQLIRSAFMTPAAINKGLAFKGGIPEALRRAANEAGYEDLTEP